MDDRDQVELPEVGAWSKKKHFYFRRYLDAFSKSQKSKWDAIHYVDLFASAGKAIIRDSREVIETSAMIASRFTPPLSRLHLCERDPVLFRILRENVLTVCDPSLVDFYNGDANEIIDRVMKNIGKSDRTLTLVFADPFGLHFDFETAKKIAKYRTDLIVLLADNMDALRNWKRYYDNDPDSNLDRFMGESGWREEFRKAESAPSENFAVRFRLRYQERLKSIGYEHFAWEPVSNSVGRDLYTLLFATRHPLGLRLWTNVSKSEPDGQRRLPFD